MTQNGHKRVNAPEVYGLAVGEGNPFRVKKKRKEKIIMIIIIQRNMVEMLLTFASGADKMRENKTSSDETLERGCSTDTVVSCSMCGIYVVLGVEFVKSDQVRPHLVVMPCPKPWQNMQYCLPGFNRWGAIR